MTHPAPDDPAPDDPAPYDPAPDPVVTDAVARALAEDLLADGDLTTALVPEEATAHFALRARQVGVLAGRACATETFRQLSPDLPLTWYIGDGSVLVPGQTIMEVTGPLRPILTAERTALNFLGHLSGVATLTARYVAAAHARNPAVEVLDTRKTTPGLRALEKAAVQAGGGVNHRSSLSEAVLVKDNHLAGITITEAVARARAMWPGRLVQIECDGVDQVAEAARAGADALLLDNMDPPTVALAIEVARAESAGPILTEVSGGVTLESIGDYAAVGPDRISVGALTHSATVVDLGLDLIWRVDAPHGEGGLNVLLVIDVGNTETVIGLYSLNEADSASEPEESVGVGIGTETDPTAPRGLTHHWRLSTVPTRTPDEHAVLLTQLLDLEGLDIAASVTGIAVSSSVPHVTGELRQMASRWFEQVPCVVLGPGTKSGMPILYDNPKEVGADRVANAVGAYDLYGGPCVVIDMGTATTVEAISAAGEYLGGAITPGVAISLEALYQHAAALRRVEMVEPRHVIGRSTVESIESGTLYGFAAQVDGLARRFMEVLGPSTVVATGGLSSMIAPHSETIEHVEPWLTLHGLRIVYERNVSDGT